jgi:hypothetical protein
MAHPGAVTRRTTWAVLTAVLMMVWAVAVALLFAVLADWTSDMGLVVAGVISGAGAAVILWLRLRRRPKSPVR